MKRHDIVYILRNDIDSSEVKYSIRSVVENFPYKSIWIYGGKPNDINPDHYVYVQQKGRTKWQKVNSTLKLICLNEQITEDFWLFNDDFFVLQKVKDVPPYYQGTLQERVNKIRKNIGRDSLYSLQLNNTIKALQDAGLPQVDYALHCPILINREKGLETIEKFKGYPMFRSLYGNHHDIGGEKVKDFKIQNIMALPDDRPFVSTSDRSYFYGEVGKMIKERFNVRSKYEV